MLLPGLFFCALLLAALSGVPGLVRPGLGGRGASWMLSAAALCGLAVSGSVLYGGHPWQAEARWDGWLWAGCNWSEARSNGACSTVPGQ